MPELKADIIRELVKHAQETLATVTQLLDMQEDEPPCLHKERIDLSTMGGEHWICKVCGFEYGK